MNKIKNKLIILSVASLAVIVLLIYFVTIPLIDQIKNLNFEINQELANLFPAGQAQTINPAKQYNLVLEGLEGQAILLNKQDALMFIDSLEDLAVDNQLEQSINLNNISELTQKNGPQAIAIELSIRGSLENTINYLAEIEKLDTYINFQQFSIYRTQAQAIPAPGEEIQLADDAIVCQIQANTYWE